MFNRQALLVVLLGLAVPVTAQQMDYATRQQMAAAVADLSAAPTPQAGGDLAAALMDRIGLDWPAIATPPAPVAGFIQTTGAVVEMVDIRLVLAQIAVQSGARDHTVLTRAQGDLPHDVILLRGGHVGLDALVALSRDTAASDAVTATATGIVLHRPLAIWADAGLTLGADDTISLARNDGSFIVNLGQLDVAGGAITGTLAPHPAAPLFRPFVLTAGQGSLTASGASFVHLGFGKVPGFAGLAVVNSGLRAAQAPSFVSHSMLDDVTGVALVGTSDAGLIGNAMRAATGAGMIIAGARGSVVTHNTLSQMSGPQAIRVTAGASDVRITANRISGQAQIGVLVDGGSDGLQIAGNLVTGAASTGLAIDTATCLRITGNLIAANGGTGIAITASDKADLQGNAILFNTGAGLLLRDQSMTADVRITRNTWIGNREGLRGATPGVPMIADNDLRGQMPRIFTGDLASRMVPWLRAQAAPVAVADRPSAGCVMAAAR